MNEPLAAAWEVSQFLAQHHVRYALIGGLAVQEWGNARLTADADFTIAAPLESSAELVKLITSQFPSRVPDAQAMAQRTRMILIRTSHGTDVDISLALPGYEDEVFRRAINVELEPDKIIYICSAEDLIIHKAIAGRPQDIADIEGVVLRQGKRLNVTYIRQWLKEFGDVLADSDVLERFERVYRKRPDK